MKSPSVRALVGLVLGLLIGGGIVWSHASVGHAFARVLEPIGTLWVNALRMTIVPLVVALLVHTLASAEGVSMFERLGRRTLATFVILLAAMAAIGVVAAPPVYSLLHVDPAAAASLRAAAGEAAPTAALPTFGSWVAGLVPANIVAAASAGSMLPLVIFAIIFGLGLARVPMAQRQSVSAFFRAIADAMLVVVQWVLALAPIGAFALAVTVTTHLGNATASVILFYLVSHAALLVLLGALLYLIVPAITRTPVTRFARSLIPAQVVVVATRSSLAALPAMIEGTERVLEISPAVTGFVLPLGVSLLRASTGLSWVVYALFLGKLYGIPLALSQLVGVAVMGVLMSFSVPGIPSGGLLIATPYFSAIGLPPQGIGILIALDAIPDIFKTLVIVTSHVSSALIVGRLDARGSRGDDGAPIVAELPAPAEV